MKNKIAELWKRLHFVSPVFFALALVAGLTGCNLTPEQIANLEKFQAEQAAQFAAKVDATTGAVAATTQAAAPLVALTGNPGAAAALPLANNLVELLGGVALAGFGVWQRLQAIRYRKISSTLIQSVDRVTTGDPMTGKRVKDVITDTARQDGIGDQLHALVKKETYNG